MTMEDESQPGRVDLRPPVRVNVYDDPMTMDVETGPIDTGDAGQVRLCSSILDTLWHRAEISINQVFEFV